MLKVLKQQRDPDRAALREIAKIVRAAGDPWAAARRVLAVLSTHFGVGAGAAGLVHETRAPHEIRATRSQKPQASDPLERVIGQGPRARRAIEEIKEAAAAERPAVLLSGAGAVATAARAIHAMSARSHGPFVQLDCTVWTDTQLEHRLFGHTGGGAGQSSPGCCERARGGTLFLDGIQALSWSAQTKLLRLLEHREFVPLGASAPMSADLRVIAGARRRLEAAVSRGAFRADLYFRLRALTVSLPALHPTAHRDAADP